MEEAPGSNWEEPYEVRKIVRPEAYELETLIGNLFGQ